MSVLVFYCHCSRMPNLEAVQPSKLWRCRFCSDEIICWRTNRDHKPKSKLSSRGWADEVFVKPIRFSWEFIMMFQPKFWCEAKKVESAKTNSRWRSSASHSAYQEGSKTVNSDTELTCPHYIWDGGPTKAYFHALSGNHKKFLLRSWEIHWMSDRTSTYRMIRKA